jgi:hypothetical protein
MKEPIEDERLQPKGLSLLSRQNTAKSSNFLLQQENPHYDRQI